MSHVALIHCPACDREWVENLFAEDHFVGHTRTCPFLDCGHKGGLHVDTTVDKPPRTLKEHNL